MDGNIVDNLNIFSTSFEIGEGDKLTQSTSVIELFYRPQPLRMERRLWKDAINAIGVE